MAKSPSSWFSRRFLLSQCDALVAVSRFVAKVLREGVYEPGSPEPERRVRPPLYGDHSKIHVLYGGVDTDRFRALDAAAQREAWGLAPTDFAFGFVGGYDPPRGKGQREFLQAAAQVHQKIPQARFLIVGRGKLKEILEKDIGRLGLTGKAWLTPYCQDMPMAMNGLDCLVHAQVGTEALGLVVLEAFACGRPVVASALDGIPEAFSVGQSGTLVPPEDVAALAAALVEQSRRPMLTPEERRALHERVASEFSLPTCAGRVVRLYQTLLESASVSETPPCRTAAA
jgi:glycosyltransferase involved in cell wall biosynthesis